MFVVGITGGIGSGKTTATDYLAALGITIVDADLASRIVVEPGRPALKAIAEHFGGEVLQANGQLNRGALRERIFRDADEKQWLESLLHPLIGEEIERALKEAGGPYAVLVSPLLVEGGQDARCDRVLVIDAPEELQVTRTVHRDNNDPEQVQRIIASQASREQRLARADDVIENTGTVDDLQRQLDELHRHYLHLAQRKLSDTSATTVNCPNCQTPVIWSRDNPNRPFCSERCRNSDFVAWANEENVIAGNPTYDDLLSGDIQPDGD